LRAQGIPPGPNYRRLLAEARAQQLDEETERRQLEAELGNDRTTGSTKETDH